MTDFNQRPVHITSGEHNETLVAATSGGVYFLVSGESKEDALEKASRAFAFAQQCGANLANAQPPRARTVQTMMPAWIAEHRLGVAV